MHLIIYSDGAARGNPGPAAAGVVILDAKHRVVKELSSSLGEMTNNQAEYRALMMGLEEAVKRGATQLSLFLDSELVVRQIKGEYRVKEATLKPLFQAVMRELQKMGSYTISHIPREKNKRADQLANLALDGQL